MLPAHRVANPCCPVAKEDAVAGVSAFYRQAQNTPFAVRIEEHLVITGGSQRPATSAVVVMAPSVKRAFHSRIEEDTAIGEFDLAGFVRMRKFRRGANHPIADFSRYHHGRPNTGPRRLPGTTTNGGGHRCRGRSGETTRAPQPAVRSPVEYHGRSRCPPIASRHSSGDNRPRQSVISRGGPKVIPSSSDRM